MMTTERVSVSSDGVQANDSSGNLSYSNDLSISGEGRYVAFHSIADNLVSGDTNENRDIFVHDRETGETTRVSVASDGTQSNGFSYQPSISSDGRYVAFVSYASNLVPGDTTSGIGDIFVHDRETGETTRVSVSSDGTQSNSSSYVPSISADGRHVAFYSDASNLVSGDTNGSGDIFVHDRDTGETTRVSVSSDGTQGNSASDYPSISADGRQVAFYSDASNLVSGDTNGFGDIFVHDQETGETTRVNVSSDGTQSNDDGRAPSISGDGRYVAFWSGADNLISEDYGLNDIFVHDRETGETTRVNVSSDGTHSNVCSFYPSISTDGRYVAFYSAASNLVTGDTNELGDIFVHDRRTGETTRVSAASDGSQCNEHSWFPSLSGDGSYVAFQSEATNLVPGDTNGVNDIFVSTVEFGPSTPTYTSSPFTVNGVYEPISGDFNGDGYGDILWYKPGTGADYIWSFNSDGSYDSNPFTVNGDYTPVVGDFDGSGTTDILWYQPGTGADYIWSFNTDGSYDSNPFTVNGEYEAIEGDFDGSGTTDILWYKPGTGADYIWSFNTNGSYDSEPFTVNGDYDPITGDFDGSGTTDILWYKAGTGADFIWSFNTDGSYDSEPFTVNGDYDPIEGDFNGNGIDDILWYKPGSGADYIWSFNADGTYDSEPFAVNGVYDPVTGDFDGNNYTDILWYQAGTGADYIWSFGN